MPSRKPGDEPDTAAELLGRWQAHHQGGPAPSPPPPNPEDASGDTSRATDATADRSHDQPHHRDGSRTTAPRAVAPRHAAARLAPPPTRPPSARGFDQTEAGREVVEALLAAPEPVSAAAPEPNPDARPDPTPDPGPARKPVPAATALRRDRRRDTRPDSAAGRSTDVVFPPRVVLRRVLGLLLLVLLAATILLGYLAYRDRTTLSIGLAGTLVVATLATYGVRVGATPTYLAIRSGQLEVVRGQQREVFDLTSRFTRMEVVGKPGRRGWKVLMARFGRDPLVIDSSMVDPASFTAALERHRPGSTQGS
ncbi:hypothetical protein [Nocardioides rubriscoriae]|uniref:hypothetical protein n=1 Tax=Nocardioides rubriscoriae TaxID=642762 RepID=UPI0011DFC580|nr:hypothetical protein [Nocardioides rubriscoriae]